MAVSIYGVKPRVVPVSTTQAPRYFVADTEAELPTTGSPPPTEGDLGYALDTSKFYSFNGTAWVITGVAPLGTVGQVLAIDSAGVPVWENPNPSIQRNENTNTALGPVLTPLPLGNLIFEDVGFFSYNAGTFEIEVLTDGIYDLQGVVAVIRTSGNPDADMAMLLNGSVIGVEWPMNLTNNVDEATITTPIITGLLAPGDKLQVAARDAGGNADATRAFLSLRRSRLV